nr:hypothetical protein [Streptomyces sp. Z38]
MDTSTGFVRDFVGRVLDEFEKLPIAVASLCDAALTIGVFGYKSGVNRIRLQNT